MIEIRLLGPVELAADGRIVELGRPQQRLVFAVLAAEAGRVVTVETMIDRVWDKAPDGARRALHVAITRLRRILEQVGTDAEPVGLVRRGGGYVLEVRPEAIDALRYRGLVSEQSGSDSERLEPLRQAMALWPGEPLAGLSGAWVDRTRSAWRMQHLDTVVAWARAELAAGNPAATIGPLTELAGEHPLTESLTEVLLRALHTTGRSADALTAYERFRKRLADELGVDPGPRLRSLHQQILNGLPVAEPRDAPPAPRQLPAAVAHFVGRAAELDVMNGLLDRRAESGGAVFITAIGGTAGVGKTALALHWAQQVASAFPDGQLYVNLRGFDAAGSVVESADAVRRFLDALRVPPERIPVDLDARAALYRTELAGRRMLIVLDNARDTTQVRPLLPGTPSCLVVVTSRNQLRGLVAAYGADPVVLDLLSEADARELLARRLGHDRVAAEPDVVAEIVARCARLPLALALVAARAALEPDTPLRALAEGLRWETLTDDEPSTDVRTVFSWSYQALGTGAARLFRLLGLHPGPDISAAAAASLAGLEVGTTQALIDELTRAGLVAEHAHGRYVMHDLLRGYAADLAATTDTDAQRHIAVHRLLDHYLHVANAADQLIDPRRGRLDLDEPLNGVTPEQLADPQQAVDWFVAERPALLACNDLAVAAGFDGHAWQLPRTLHAFFSRHGHWHDQVASTSVALAAAERLGDTRAQVQILRNLASACVMLRRFDEAQAHLNTAVELGARTDDLRDRGHTHHSFAFFWDHRGRHADALRHATEALDLYRASGHEPGQAIALNTVGWCHSMLGHHERARDFCRQALALHESLGNPPGQADTLHSLGHAHHQLGQYDEAMDCYERALGLLRDIGNRYNQTTVLTSIGDTHQAASDDVGARHAWQQALTILEELGHPDAEELRTKLTT
jgi:DNA-binding SARP family transcriptional activator/Tfp pilus assembly protein PilF